MFHTPIRIRETKLVFFLLFMLSLATVPVSGQAAASGDLVLEGTTISITAAAGTAGNDAAFRVVGAARDAEGISLTPSVPVRVVASGKSHVVYALPGVATHNHVRNAIDALSGFSAMITSGSSSVLNLPGATLSGGTTPSFVEGGTTVIVEDGAMPSNTPSNDRIDLLEVEIHPDNTATVRVNWFFSDSGSFSAANGVHLRVLYDSGSGWNQVYSRMFHNSVSRVGDGYIDEQRDIGPPPGGPGEPGNHWETFTISLSGSGTQYVRAAIIDRASNTDVMTGDWGCGTCGTAGSSGRHFDNADVQFSLPVGEATAAEGLIAVAGSVIRVVSTTPGTAANGTWVTLTGDLDAGLQSDWRGADKELKIRFTPGVTTVQEVITEIAASAEFDAELYSGSGSTPISASSATLSGGTLPPPTNLAATHGNESISVAFTPPNDPGGESISGYEYSLDDGASWIAPVPEVTESPLALTGLVSGTTYSIRLRGVSASGPGAASVSVSATPSTIPDAPLNVVFTSDDSSALVAFDAPSSDGGAEILNYEYSVDGVWTARSPASTTSPFVIGGLVNGEVYAFALRAINVNGPGPASPVVEMAITTDPDASESSVAAAEPGTVVGSTVLITVTVRDANGFLRNDGGDEVFLDTTLGVIGPLSDNGNGTYSATVASEISGTSEVSAYLGTDASGELIGSVEVVFAPGPPSSMVVVEQPKQTVAGETMAAPSVRVFDSFGNRVSGGHIIQVVLEGADFAPASELSSITDSDGLATFPELRIRAAGQGYALQFAHDSMDPAP